MKIVTISDTRGYHNKLSLPRGDVLIHTGDLTYYGGAAELEEFLKWFKKLPFEYKIFIGGDHDTCLDKELVSARVTDNVERIFDNYFINHELGSISYLCNTSLSLWGVNFYGSPYTSNPYYGLGHAFKKSKKELSSIWRQVPKKTDVLLTHCPPVYACDYDESVNKGCRSLRLITKLIKPKVHCFGHVTAGYGIYVDSDTFYINGSAFSNTKIVDSISFNLNEKTKHLSLNDMSNIPLKSMTEDII